MATSEQVAWSIYGDLDARDRRAVDAWRDLGNDMVTSLFNADVMSSRQGHPRLPADDTAEWMRRRAGSPELTLEATCEHEAAHAVVAHALGVRVVEMSVSDDGLQGLTRYETTTPTAAAIIAAAAEVWITEFRATAYPAEDNRGFGDDRSRVVRNTGSELEARDAYRRARLLLGECRDQVIPLARELARTHQLDRPGG